MVSITESIFFKLTLANKIKVKSMPSDSCLPSTNAQHKHNILWLNASIMTTSHNNKTIEKVNHDLIAVD